MDTQLHYTTSTLHLPAAFLFFYNTVTVENVFKNCSLYSC